MNTKEIKFKMTADTKDIDKAIDKLSERTDYAAMKMSKFSEIIEKTSKEDLGVLTKRLNKDLEEATKKLNNLKYESERKSNTSFAEKIKEDLDAAQKEVTSLSRKIGAIKIEEKERNFRITADTKTAEKSIKDLIKTANLGAVEMDAFVAVLENASTVQLDKIMDGLLNDLDETENKLADLQRVMLDVMSADEIDVERFNILREEIVKTEQEMSNLNERIDMIDASNVEEAGNKFGWLAEKTEALSKKMKKLGRRILVAFSFAAFGTFRRGFSESINMSDTAKSKFEAITMSIAAGLVPIVDILVNKIQYAFVWMAKLVYLLTGVNIIQKGMEQTAKKINKIGASAKKAGKQIAGAFSGLDEITDISQSSGDGGNVGVGTQLTGLTQTMDELNKMQDIFNKINIKWAEDLGKWLKNNIDLVKKFGIALGVAWGLSKVGLLKPILSGISKLFGGLFTGVTTGSKDAVRALTDTERAGKLALLGLTGLVTSFTIISTGWDKMSTGSKIFSVALSVVSGAMLAVGGSALIMGTSIATAISVATLGIGALIGAVVAAIAVFVNWVKKSIAAHKEIKNVEEATKSLEEATKKYGDALSNHANAIDSYEEKLSALEEAEKRTGESGQALYEQVQNGTISYEEMNAQQREVFKAYLDMEQAQREVETAMADLKTASQEQKKADLELQLSKSKSAEEMLNYRDAVVKAMEDGSISAEQGKELLEKAMADMDRASQKTFMEGIPDSISEGLKPNRYAGPWKKFKDFFGGGFDWIGDKASKLWKGIKETFTNIAQKVGDAITNTVKKAIEGVLKTAIKIINGFISGINLAISAINVIPGVNIKKLDKMEVPSFDVGTPYVPEDMYAFIHKGERIVPEKYNHDDYLNPSVDLSETNDLLEEVRDAIRKLKLFVDRDAIGEASVEYIKQQSRLRGEAII